MEDFSKVFTLEFFGSKGWEVGATKTSWDSIIEESQKWCGDYQIRITSPVHQGKAGNELVERLELIQNHYDQGNISPQEYGDLIVAAVKDRL